MKLKSEGRTPSTGGSSGRRKEELPFKETARREERKEGRANALQFPTLPRSRCHVRLLLGMLQEAMSPEGDYIGEG